MAHTSVSPQTANIKDGDNERNDADLEDGELEEGELDDVDPTSLVKEEPVSKPVVAPPIVTPPTASIPLAKKEKSTKEKPSSRPEVKRKPSHHHFHQERNKDLSEPEDEWAGVVEKAIKRAMGKDVSSEKNDTEENEIPGSQSPDERKYKRKKRKKKHREEDVDEGEEEDEEEKRTSKKRKKSHHWAEKEEGSIEEKPNEDEEGEDEDDDEMLFVRGASPVMKNAFADDDSPSSSSYLDNPYPFSEQGYDENYDSYGEEESDFEEREDFSRLDDDGSGPKRGLGRGMKRRQRGLGRLLPLGKRLGRKETKTKRGSGKRQTQRGTQERNSDCICMFYMQGKCQKGEDCPYSHNALPPRKMELCKFYLMDCCAKKDKCLYMHHDFPCKFYHTGLKCFAGPRCKFSHGHLSETLRSILLKHLETAPKEILGDFPRLSREGAAAMVYSKKNRLNKAKKIPSLFDIEVPIPVQLLAEQREAAEGSPSRRTPMPDSDNEDEERSEITHSSSKAERKSSPKLKRHNSEDDETSRDSPEKESEEMESNKIMSSDENNSKHQDYISSRQHVLKLTVEDEQEKKREKKREEKAKKEGRTKQELNLLRLAGYLPDTINDGEEKPASVLEKSDERVSKMKSKEEEKKENNCPIDNPLENTRDSQIETGESGGESNDGGNIPLHLPKKQRELFLRIQQQQRQVESCQDQSADGNGDEDSQQEENWYSSDEEDDSLTDVLKNLSRLDEQKSSETAATSSAAIAAASSVTTTTATTTPLAASSVLAGPNFDKLKLPDLSKIDISESVSKLLSSIRYQQQMEESSTSEVAKKDTLTTVQPSNPTPARDPRLSRDPRSRSQNNPATAAGEIAASTTASASPTRNMLSSPSSQDSRRNDPRRINDPRKTDHRHHAGSVSSRRSSSGSSHAPTFTSIYSNAIMADTALPGSKPSTLSDRFNVGDMDLRNILSHKDLESSDVDLRQVPKPDLDLRTVPQSSVPYRDTDLRSNVTQLADSGRSSSDVDLRRILELPFKPVPVHTPATEIDASLTSHLPIPYKVVPVTIPRPDYTSLKLNTADPQVQNDPRLRKLFKLGSSPPSASKNITSNLTLPASRSDPRSVTGKGNRGNSVGSDKSNSGPYNVSSVDYHDSQVHMQPERFPEFSPGTAMSPSALPTHGPLVPGVLANSMLPAQTPPLANFDPRMPRNPRNAPGLLGPAPLPTNYCPSTPLYDEEEDSNESDGPRMFYGRMNPLENSMWGERQQEQQQQHRPQRSNWRGRRRKQQQRI